MNLTPKKIQLKRCIYCMYFNHCYNVYGVHESLKAICQRNNKRYFSVFPDVYHIGSSKYDRRYCDMNILTLKLQVNDLIYFIDIEGNVNKEDVLSNLISLIGSIHYVKDIREGVIEKKERNTVYTYIVTLNDNTQTKDLLERLYLLYYKKENFVVHFMESPLRLTTSLSIRCVKGQT